MCAVKGEKHEDGSPMTLEDFAVWVKDDTPKKIKETERVWNSIKRIPWSNINDMSFYVYFILYIKVMSKIWQKIIEISVIKPHLKSGTLLDLELIRKIGTRKPNDITQTNSIPRIQTNNDEKNIIFRLIYNFSVRSIPVLKIHSSLFLFLSEIFEDIKLEIAIIVTM